MDTSLPWLRDRGPLSSRQRETGKCFCLLDFIVVHGWRRGAGGGWEAQSHEDFRVGVILGGVGTEINRVLMMMMMEAHGQSLMSFCVLVGW